MAKGELYPDYATAASLILMGDWCSKADIEHKEDPGCGEETVTDVFKTQKRHQLRSRLRTGLLCELDRGAFNG